MKIVIPLLLAFFAMSYAGEGNSAFLSKKIDIEFNGKNKIKVVKNRILIQDDIPEDDFRHFGIPLPYDGKIKEVDIAILRNDKIYREFNLKDAEKYIHRPDYILASDFYFYYWDLGSLDPGDIVESQYILEYKNASYGDYEPVLGKIPVEKASVSIKYNQKDWSLRYSIDNGAIELERQNGEMEFHWIDLPGLNDSDFKDAPRDRLPGIRYLFESKVGKRDYSGWNRVYAWNVDLCKGTSLTEQNSGLLRIAETPEEIFMKVIDGCRYVAVEIDKGRYKPMPAGKVWNQKYGDCKGLANLFVSWLNLAGYDAWPVLVRSDDSYMGNNDFPSPYVFDHEIAAFVGYKGDTIYQDLTAESVPFGDLPISLYGDFALPLVDNTAPIRLPCSRRDPDTVSILINGVIDNSFVLRGSLVYRQTGQRAIREIWKTENTGQGTDRASLVKSELESALKMTIIGDIVENFPGDSVITVTAEVVKQNLGFTDDTLLVLKPWVMTYLKYGTKPDSNVTWPKIMRRNISYITEYRCELGNSDIILHPGDEIIQDSGFVEFSSVDNSHGDSLIIETALTLRPCILDPDQYREYVQRRLDISNMLSQGLVFSNK